jgi:hypothetical protein
MHITFLETSYEEIVGAISTHGKRKLKWSLEK